MKKPERILWALSAVILIMLVIALVNHYRSPPGSSSTPGPKSSPSKAVNTFISKYAGGYTVEVTGYSAGDVESYVLRRDGTAKWMWIVPDATRGARVDSEKSGSWTASEGKIVISIRGNTGTIKEEFRMRSGQFYSTTSSDRYLKPTQ